MDFRSNIANARSMTQRAISELAQYDLAADPGSVRNRTILGRTRELISPGATRYGSAALDAARWERWVSIRQIRDTGDALALLDRAWWSLSDRAGRPDVAAARRSLHDAVRMLDSASWGSRWAAPAAAPWLVAAS